MIKKTTHIHDSQGLFTFNFFCESLIGALHSLSHALEEHHDVLPQNAEALCHALTETGIHLFDDYSSQSLTLSRIEEDVLLIYKLSMALHDDLLPLAEKSHDEVQYYYLVYLQGMNLFYPNFLRSLMQDIPLEENPDAFADELDKKISELEH